MKKIFVFLFLFSTFLFSQEKTLVETPPATSFNISESSGGCGSCESVLLTAENGYPTFRDLGIYNSCGNLVVPQNFTFVSCILENTYTRGNCEEWQNGTKRACVQPIDNQPKYTLTYKCDKYDLTEAQRPLSSDGITRMEIDPDTCEWIEPCIPPTDFSVSSHVTHQECLLRKNEIESLSSFSGGRLYCFTCNPDGTNSVLYQSYTSCDAGSGIVSKSYLNSNYQDCSNCFPLSNSKVSVSKSSCQSGNIFYDYDNGYYGTSVIWQDCDNSCYLTEPQQMNCDYYDNFFSKKSNIDSVCDTDLNNFSYSCTNDASGKAVPIIDCKPKNEQILNTPCDKELDKAKTLCKDNNMTLIGQCSDNGIIITSNTLDCEDLNITMDKNCDGLNEVFTSGTCSCKEGYSRNEFGSCWKNLDSNATTEEIIKDDLEKQKHEEQEEQKEQQEQTNDELKKQSNHLKNISDTVKGLRSDINTSNNLLNSIQNALGNDTDLTDLDSSDIDNALGILESLKNEYQTFYDNAKNQLAIVEDQYNNAKNIFETGTINNTVSGGTTEGCFTANVFGSQISIELCPFFSQISPLIYFIITLYLMIQVFLFSFHYFMRSFE